MEKTAEYMRIYRDLKAKLKLGAYPLNKKLPSKRIIARENSVSVITAEHALELLKEEGYLYTKERSGYFSAFSGLKEETGQKPYGIQMTKEDFFENISESVTSPMLLRAMRRTVNQFGGRMLERSPGKGLLELREELSQYILRSKGIRADPENIIIGSGAEYLYGLIVMMLGRERNYIIEEPSYEKIERIYRANGARVIRKPILRDGMDLKDYRNAAVHLTPLKSFPSGVTLSPLGRKYYTDWSRENDSFIIEDDYMSDLYFPGGRLESLYSMAPERVIYISTFTKTIAPSLRAGYLVLPMGILNEFYEKISFYSCSVPVFEQLLIYDLLKTGEYERHLNRIRKHRKALA